jgi:hypothetical protein
MTQASPNVVSDVIFSEIIGAQLYVTEPSFNLILSREYKPNYIEGYKFAIRLIEDAGPSLDPYVFSNLNQDRNTTKAVAHGFLEYPNFISAQFLIRDGGMYMIVNTKMNDVWASLPRDFQAFGFWGQLMAGMCDVPFKGYIHNFGSLRLHAADVKRALDVIRLEHSVDAVASPLPSRPFKALTEIIDGSASLSLEIRGEERRTSPLGMQPIINAILGDRENAAAVLNELAAKGYGVGWPPVSSSSVAPSP